MPTQHMDSPEGRIEDLLALIREFNHLAPDLAQLLDGWHCDVAWSPWDQSVRDRLAALQRKTDSLTD